jgi:hypothetical protein
VLGVRVIDSFLSYQMLADHMQRAQWLILKFILGVQWLPCKIVPFVCDYAGKHELSS